MIQSWTSLGSSHVGESNRQGSQSGIQGDIWEKHKTSKKEQESQGNGWSKEEMDVDKVQKRQMMTAYKHKKTMLEMMVVKVFMVFPTMFPVTFLKT